MTDYDADFRLVDSFLESRMYQTTNTGTDERMVIMQSDLAQAIRDHCVIDLNGLPVKWAEAKADDAR